MLTKGLRGSTFKGRNKLTEWAVRFSMSNLNCRSPCAADMIYDGPMSMPAL